MSWACTGVSVEGKTLKKTQDLSAGDSCSLSMVEGACSPWTWLSDTPGIGYRLLRFVNEAFLYVSSHPKDFLLLSRKGRHFYLGTQFQRLQFKFA